MDRLLVILNPNAGRGQAGRRWRELARALRQADVTFELLFTSQQGGARALARQAIGQGYQRLAVVGGDGTLHEAVNGVMECQYAEDTRYLLEVALGIVPVGTGNDFIKSLTGFVADDLAGAAARLARGHTLRVDVGRVRVTSADEGGTETHYFINNLALGIDALVAAESQQVTYLRGRATYLVGAVQALRRFELQSFQLRYNQANLYKPLLLATVANGRCQGGGFWLTPAALLDDGLLDLCLVEPLPPAQIVPYMLRGMRGTHAGLPAIRMAQASQIDISYDRPALVVADGEILATTAQHVAIQTLPRALRLMV